MQNFNFLNKLFRSWIVYQEKTIWVDKSFFGISELRSYKSTFDLFLKLNYENDHDLI